MNDRYFIDTNIFVYSFDISEPVKNAIANNLIASALHRDQGVISFQVLQEFLNVASSKFRRPMKAADLREYLRNVLFPLCEVYPGYSLYEQAISIREETGFSFYDALIISAAIEGKCSVLFSEDMQNGQDIRGTIIKNPFL